MPTDGRGEPRLVAAPDKLRGTLTAAQAAAVLTESAQRAGWAVDPCPLSDGGEGFADALAGLGGREMATLVSGPLGDRVSACWRLVGPLAVLESAAASGIELAGGAGGNRPLEATSQGTGDLIVAALGAGATRVLVGAGGSAMTDGGRAAVEVVEDAGGIGAAELVVACDVDIGFVDAAERFAPQKGAGPSEVGVLRRRLETLAEHYRQRYGVDVTRLVGAGAAGGLAGGLAAIGARLVPGFSLVAEMVGLERRLQGAALVVSAEGRLDASSCQGKVVGGLARMTKRAGLDLVVLAGSVDGAGAQGAQAGGVGVVSLEDRCGERRARSQAAACLADAASAVLEERRPSS